jgi:hypothetical protein
MRHDNILRDAISKETAPQDEVRGVSKQALGSFRPKRIAILRPRIP